MYRDFIKEKKRDDEERQHLRSQLSNFLKMNENWLLEKSEIKLITIVYFFSLCGDSRVWSFTRWLTILWRRTQRYISPSTRRVYHFFVNFITLLLLLPQIFGPPLSLQFVYIYGKKKKNRLTFGLWQQTVTYKNFQTCSDIF